MLTNSVFKNIYCFHALIYLLSHASSSPSQRTTPFPLPLHHDTPFCRYVYFCLFFCFCCFGLYFAFFFFVSFCLIFWSLFSSRVLLLGRESIGDLSNSFIGRSSEDQILSSRSLFKSWH